jgi:hypothetical protein
MLSQTEVCIFAHSNDQSYLCPANRSSQDFCTEVLFANDRQAGWIIEHLPASEVDAADWSGATGLLTSVLTSSALALAKSQVGGAAARGFDVFEVGGTSLEIGRRFGQNVFVLAKYDWMSLSEKENAVEVTVELRVGRHWQFDLISGSAAISSVGLSRKWRF